MPVVPVPAHLVDEAQRRIDRVREKTEEQIDKVFQPDELPPGVVQLVKVYVAQKRKISVGDKMAGRHGNKGIIARIAPEEDMPFLPDGTPVPVEVAFQLSVAGSYRPPVFADVPPQTIILSPVHTET